MEINIKEAKTVALANLKLLKVHPEAIKGLEDKGTVWVSENHMVSFNGSEPVALATLYDPALDNYTFATETKAALDVVRKDGFYPYHVVQSYAEFGNLFAVLYIADAESDKLKIEDYDHEFGFEALAYVYNADDKDCSEYGYVCLKPRGGGILRTA